MGVPFDRELTELPELKISLTPFSLSGWWLGNDIQGAWITVFCEILVTVKLGTFADESWMVAWEVIFTG